MNGDSTFRSNSEHSFSTQRPVGSTFTFDLQADPHMDSNSDPAVYTNTLRNETNDRPDFLIDLGDTFMTEKFAVTQEQVDRRYIETRAFFDIPGASSPVFLVNGNHDGWFVIWLGIYYIVSARSESKAFIRTTVYGRPTFLGFLGVLVAFGMVEPVIIVFGVVDLITAIWTYRLLCLEKIAAASLK